MLNITIDVCGEPIVRVHALRIAGEKHEMCTYQIYDDDMKPIWIVKHHYDCGAEALAMVALNAYRGYKEGKELMGM